MRQCLTAVVERNVTWEGDFATEPWEAAWASEAIFFVRVLEAPDEAEDLDLQARVQISPDGLCWCDEGGQLELLPGEALGAVRVGHFGGWLRLAGRVPPGRPVRVIAYLNLKE